MWINPCLVEKLIHPKLLPNLVGKVTAGFGFTTASLEHSRPAAVEQVGGSGSCWRGTWAAADVECFSVSWREVHYLVKEASYTRSWTPDNCATHSDKGSTRLIIHGDSSVEGMGLQCDRLTLISLSCWLLQGRTMQILVCLSSWQRWLSLVMRDETAMPQVAEHSLHSVVWTMQLSLGLSATDSWGDTRLKTETGFEEGKGWIWEAPVWSGRWY